MRFTDVPGYVRDTLLRMFPHRAPTGLFPIGQPGPDAPVLVTGNFTLTVRRMKEALSGHDVWLLVVDSDGINVWCAAGGGHLTHHDVIAGIRTSRLVEHIDHREIVLPQLCATGVERSKVTSATGFSTRWGPARLEDLSAFLGRGLRVKRRWRFVRFPLWERMEMAVMWFFPMAIITGPIMGLIWGVQTMAGAVSAMGVAVFGIFGLLPWLPMGDRRRWLIFGTAVLLSAGAGSAELQLLSVVSGGEILVVGVAATIAMGVLAVDLAGTTPWYGSYINTFHNEAHIELVADRCTGAAECVQVCPRNVLAMNGKARKVEITRPEQCIQCGACIVQCPEDALRFRYDDGRVVEAPTIRNTRMNMLGRRSVELHED